MITFKCFHCNEELEAPGSMVGETIKCPGCGRNEVVPNPDALHTAGADELGTDENPVPIDVDFGIDPQDLQTCGEAAWDAVHPERGPRKIHINTVGEVILSMNNKSVQCPIREKRCTCTCAWFSFEHELKQALCQSRIVIGEVEKNEYGKEDAKAGDWGKSSSEY